MARITAFLETGTRVSVRTDRHEWFADEPVADGGTGQGPTPYEMLLGSLAACTALTVRYYAKFKGIELRWIRAEYEFDRTYAEDCQECESTDAGKMERVTAYVSIGGDFDEAQQKRLRQIVGLCPVHKTLAHGIRISDDVQFIGGDPDRPISESGIPPADETEPDAGA